MNVNGQSLIGGTNFEIRLRRSVIDGAVIATLDNIAWMNYTLTVSGTGYWAIGLIDFDLSLLAEDRIIDISRRPAGGQLAQDFKGLLLNPNPMDDMSNNPHDQISGAHINHLLTWRTVSYDEGTDEAQATAIEADDAMKAVVRENFGVSAATGRQFNSDNLTVASDVTLGEVITQSFSRRPVLQVLQQMADASRQLGTEVYFGLVPTGKESVEFRTRIGQWGIDRSKSTGANPLVFSSANDSLVGASFEEDFTNHKNAVTALGQGEGDTEKAVRTTVAGNFAETRKEITVNAGNEAEVSGVGSRAEQGLVEYRPRKIFTGTFQSVPGNLYGIDWALGTRASAQFRDQSFDIQVRSVTISLNGQGKESVTAQMEIYE